MNKNYTFPTPSGVGNNRLYFPLSPTFCSVDSSRILSFSAFVVMLLLSFESIQAQSVYLTSSGGCCATEKWMSITTGANGTGTLVWSQGAYDPYPPNNTSTGGGLLNDEAIDLTAHCGQTLYLNAYDRYADTWDGTVYSLETAASGGTVIINNGGNSPNGAGNNDCNGSNWCATDPDSELESSEAFSIACLCTDPAATFSLASNCPTDFSISVDVTATGDGATVDITNDGGVAATNGVGIGMYNIGPFALGTDVTVTVNADGGCSIDSGVLTEECGCATIPTATVTTTNLDCGASTVDIEVTIDSDGSGDANMTDILINGAIVQANATTNTLYTFSQAVGTYTITLEAEGAGFATCTSIDYPVSVSCTNLQCSDAFNVPIDGTPVTTSPIPNSSTTYVGTSCDASGNEETWFTFTAPNSGLVILTIDNYTSAFDNLDYALFSGACGSLTEVSCAAGNSATPVDAELNSGLTPGATYYLQTSLDNGGGETFDVSLTNPVSNITAFTSNCFDLSTAVHLYDLGNGGDDYDCGLSASYSGSTDDQIGYIYTPVSNETVDLVIDNVTTTSSNDFAIAIFDNTTGIPVNCIDGTTTSADVTLTGISLTGGTDYLIIIGGYDSTHDAQGCLTIQPQCNAVFTNTLSNDCSAGTYSRTLNFSSFGAATSVNLTDGTTTYNAISTATDYVFSYTSTSGNTVTINGYDAGANLICSETVDLSSGCNGSDDFSTSAPNILGTCGSGGIPGDLSIATVGMAQGFTSFCDDGGAGGSTGNNFIRDCSAANFDNNTNWVDIWYQVDLPDGSDELTLEVTGLNAGEIVGYVLYTADPGTDAGSNEATADSNMGCSFFDNTVTSHTISGLADESTAPIYIRMLSIAFDDGAGCGAIINPTFTICASAPQPNDICNDGLNINSFDDDVTNAPDAFTPVTQSGDISQANVDADTHDVVNGETCNGITFDTNEEDLWYAISTPATGNFYLELDIDFTGIADEIYVLLHNYCANGDTDPIGCESISADGTVTFDQNNITNFDNALTPNNDFNIRIVRPTGSTATTFDISAQLVAENNTCDVMQNVFPGFDVENMNNDLNFNFATDSGASPVIAGNDLWYQFDPVQTSDPVTGLNTASTTAEIVIGGLAAGQELTLVLYKGEGISANNCTDLAGNYLETLVVTGNGIEELACLDELHLATDGGYIIRVIQTAGTTIDNGLINVQPQPAGPYNNDCENIWGGSGPTNLGWTDPSPGPSDGINDGGLAVNFNPFVIEEGFSNYVSGDFENSTDCNPNTASALCNGVDQQAILSNEDRDLWYIITLPDDTCPATGLASSSVINSVTFLYNAGSAFEDGVIYLYSDCGDANLIDCSGPLDGAPSGAGDDQFNDPQSTWTVSGLTQGQSYLVRVKPHDISSSGVNNEFDFDLSWKSADPAPCNDDPANAEPLSVACFDYSALETWSAQGATETSPVDGAPESDVWFSFVAPDNGGTYTSAGSWTTVFFETVSGEQLFVELYNTMTTSAASETYTASGAGDQGWAVFGNLNAGQTYYVRMYHKEPPSVNVQYKIAINDGPGIEPGWGCGETSLSNISDCASGCVDLRETFFKIDLPDGTPGNAYWAIEVTGIDQDLNFELRSKYLNGASTYVTSPSNGTDGASEGGFADFDHPCSSRVLEPAVSITSTTDDIPGCDGNDSLGDIDPASTSQGTDGNTAIGSGTKRVYFNMNGAVAGQKDYYFLRVFIESTDPRYNDWAEVKICDISFQGPYSTAALADAGGTPDLQCLSCDISDVAITTNGTCNGSNAEFTLNFDLANGSGDYEIFATADNATYGITTGDVLGTITSAGATGTDVAISGSVTNTTSAGTISVDIRDTNDPTGCIGGTPVTINIPACSTCSADAGDISNNSSTPNTLAVCEGSDLLDGATEIIFSADYTAGDETDAGAGHEYAFVLADAAGTIQATSTDGNFDFSGITAGTYTVHGVSYSTSNTINTVAAYLTSITGDATVDDISQIETDEVGATVCVDIDNGALTGHSTSVTINAAPSATVTTTATVCNVATETGEDEGQEDLDVLVTAGDMTGTWTILSGNTGGTATITGTMAGSDVLFDAGTEAGPIVVRYTLTGTSPCTDATYDVTITRIDCGACAPEVGVTRSN